MQFFPLETCGMGQIKCARIRKCIKSASRCDGNVNCPDFSDEQECCKNVML